MGTLLDITVFTDSAEQGTRILNDTFAIAEHLDAVLSTWKQDSAVSRFNRDTSREPREVDADMYALVEQSKELSAITEGAFSIGVRPLVELWEGAAKRNRLPSLSEREVARRRAAADSLIVGRPNLVGKRLDGVMIETGGIGKGYAVDRMISFLKTRQVNTAFINFGRSSIAALGAPPGESGWRVDVALTESTHDATALLHDETLTVSRAHGNPFVVAGTSYAHIFDPASGMPVEALRGAAIRASSATVGEALVKYLVIRGAPRKETENGWGDVAWIVRTGPTVAQSNMW